MIKIGAAHIEEMRGIRKLDLNFAREKFAISGPNGSGKSGVIDAIEFGLTGRISRLTGSGTKGLSVSEHGPHVDKTKFPDAAFIELDVFFPALGKSAKITRKVSAPNKPKIDPPDADVKAALGQVEDHPEITLSRRDVLRFILIEPSKRSEEIQTLLKLDEIGQTRSTLNTAQNKLQQTLRASAAAVTTAKDMLRLHLQTPALNTGDLLEAVNKRRKVLNLSEIAELTADTTLDSGLTEKAKTLEFNKESALRDLQAVSDPGTNLQNLAKEAAATIVADLEKLESDPALFQALQRRSFIEKGLNLVDGPACPLCDKPWEDEEHLREHLLAKLAKSEAAEKIQQSLLNGGLSIAESGIRVIGLITAIEKLAERCEEKGFAKLLAVWKVDIENFRGKLTSFDGLAEAKDRLIKGWLGTPPEFADGLKALTEKVQGKPDQTATVDAQTFLTTAQVRLQDYRTAMKRHKSAEDAWKAGKAVYDTYCAVMEEKLNALYDSVQKDFSTFYRMINGDDETSFTAKLTPSEGTLDFTVNFYERGLFPPAAYHSEGHQDGMGVCLYLALMKRLFGKGFTFALLDDVVMSVDTGHRYEFCKLLKTEFPDTQFIITTHDRLWAEQMKSAGLVTSKTSVAFHSWTVETGPLVESSAEIWEDIATALGKGKVETAAAALRRHLEYVSRLLADQIAAAPAFRADGNYELGDLLPSVLSRMKTLLGKAAEAAQSWGNDSAKEDAAKRKSTLSTCAGAQGIEQWAINKAVHYNEWTNFGKKDFEPVVTAFKELLECFRCDKCSSWVYITPRAKPESLRCSCNSINLNLKSKPK
ncbi:MAG: chromosome segregation protein SMC [Hyphomicrobiales bacterium]|nr:MAG: chromosome segregation protein SMC [Hyphomicrobiales bacterium]